MKALADAIDGNFGDEKQKAFEQLQNFYDKDGLSRDLQATKLRTSPLPLFTAKGECSPKEACRTNIPTCLLPAGATARVTSRLSGPRKPALLHSSISTRWATIPRLKRRFPM